MVSHCICSQLKSVGLLDLVSLRDLSVSIFFFFFFFLIPIAVGIKI